MYTQANCQSEQCVLERNVLVSPRLPLIVMICTGSQGESTRHRLSRIGERESDEGCEVVQHWTYFATIACLASSAGARQLFPHRGRVVILLDSAGRLAVVVIVHVFVRAGEYRASVTSKAYASSSNPGAVEAKGGPGLRERLGEKELIGAVHGCSVRRV